jgi:hypothetical protein
VTHRRAVLALALALPLVLGALAGCGNDGVSGTPPAEAEESVAPVGGDPEEPVSFDALADQAQARADELGLDPAVLACVVAYLDEAFDEELAQTDASLALDEAFGACAAVTNPQPIEDLPPGGG